MSTNMKPMSAQAETILLLNGPGIVNVNNFLMIAELVQRGYVSLEDTFDGLIYVITASGLEYRKGLA